MCKQLGDIRAGDVMQHHHAGKKKLRRSEKSFWEFPIRSSGSKVFSNRNEFAPHHRAQRQDAQDASSLLCLHIAKEISNRQQFIH